MDDLTAAGYGDVVEFFTKYYSPNNASLVIAGDIDLAETRELVEKWFSEVPKGDPVDKIAVPTPEVTEEVRLVLEDDVKLPRIYMCWASPPAYAPGDAAADVTASILGGGKNSRLYKALVYEKEIAQDVEAYVDSGLSSQFIVIVTARKGHTLEELRGVIDAEIAKLQRTAPAKREVERVVNGNEVRFLESVERLNRRANMLNRYLYYVGEPGYFEKDLARYKKLTPNTIREYAKGTLPSSRRVLLSIVPAGSADLAASNSEPVDKKKEGVQ
jgi:zinc protease